MKLSDLNPKWVLGSRFDIGSTMHFIYPGATHDRHGMGISFDCPVHRTHKLAVFFSNPIDGRPPQVEKHLWNRTGDTFETLSLSPSVDATNAEFPNCWHGHITNGEIV